MAKTSRDNQKRGKVSRFGIERIPSPGCSPRAGKQILLGKLSFLFVFPFAFRFFFFKKETENKGGGVHLFGVFCFVFQPHPTPHNTHNPGLRYGYMSKRSGFSFAPLHPHSAAFNQPGRELGKVGLRTCPQRRGMEKVGKKRKEKKGGGKKREKGNGYAFVGKRMGGGDWGSGLAAFEKSSPGRFEERGLLSSPYHDLKRPSFSASDLGWHGPRCKKYFGWSAER